MGTTRKLSTEGLEREEREVDGDTHAHGDEGIRRLLQQRFSSNSSSTSTNVARSKTNAMKPKTNHTPPVPERRARRARTSGTSNASIARRVILGPSVKQRAVKTRVVDKSGARARRKEEAAPAGGKGKPEVWAAVEEMEEPVEEVRCSCRGGCPPCAGAYLRSNNAVSSTHLIPACLFYLHDGQEQ